MFEQETPLTKRINELAKKAKTVGLTEAEKEEQTLSLIHISEPTMK